MSPGRSSTINLGTDLMLNTATWETIAAIERMQKKHIRGERKGTIEKEGKATREPHK